MTITKTVIQHQFIANDVISATARANFFSVLVTHEHYGVVWM